ncbi:unknown [Prevotella sp. CAG:873]|nr:unknown [Prevotella sp. CAG:873]
MRLNTFHNIDLKPLVVFQFLGTALLECLYPKFFVTSSIQAYRFGSVFLIELNDLSF